MSNINLAHTNQQR